MTTPIVILMASSEMETAIMAPTAEPAAHGKMYRKSCMSLLSLFLYNRLAPTKVCNRIPTRFVPLAICAGNPMKSKNGNVKREPLPAKVFIIPATKPAIIARK